MNSLMLKRREGVEADADTRSRAAPRRSGRAVQARGVSHNLLGPPPVTLSHTPFAVQAKLTVSSPGDAYEREADSVAERVMRMPDTTVRLQRKCGCGGSGGECGECEEKKTRVQRYADTRSETAAAAPAVVSDVLRSEGQPLDAGTRAFMEPRFGVDLGHVRVHADSRAAKSARAVNALAYTVGRDVVFGAGQYAPGTSAGRHLLAHELAHTVQQTGGHSGLMIQRMAACPATLDTEAVPSGWKAYHGNSCVFHCCYRGILEDRTPTPEDPQNECFYDRHGHLVDENHPYAGCRGTPNQYDSSSSPISHAFRDSGGIWQRGWGAFTESLRHDFKAVECGNRCLNVPGPGKFFCMQQCMNAE